MAQEKEGSGGSVPPDGKRSLPKGAHVRFSHVEVDGGAAQEGLNTASTTTANNQTTASSLTNGSAIVTTQRFVWHPKGIS